MPLSILSSRLCILLHIRVDSTRSSTILPSTELLTSSPAASAHALATPLPLPCCRQLGPTYTLLFSRAFPPILCPRLGVRRWRWGLIRLPRMVCYSPVAMRRASAPTALSLPYSADIPDSPPHRLWSLSGRLTVFRRSRAPWMPRAMRFHTTMGAISTSPAWTPISCRPDSTA